MLSTLAPTPAPPLPEQPELVEAGVTDAEIEAMEQELLKDVDVDQAGGPRATTSAARATTQAEVGEDDAMDVEPAAAAAKPTAPVIGAAPVA